VYPCSGGGGRTVIRHWLLFHWVGCYQGGDRALPLARGRSRGEIGTVSQIKEKKRGEAAVVANRKNKRGLLKDVL